MKLQNNAEIKHTQKKRKYKIQDIYFKTQIEIHHNVYNILVSEPQSRVRYKIHCICF